MTVSVIVCAAGSGTRAAMGKNKLLVPLYGAPVIYHTVNTVFKLKTALKEGGDELKEIIIAASPRDMLELTAVCAPFRAKIIEGGKTRTESVYKALKYVSGETVLIQDGARPFTLLRQYAECIACVKEYGSAVTAMPATDTVYIEKDGWTAHIPERNAVLTVQTPQGFITEDIKTAYEQAIKSGEIFTDDGSVYTRYISPARICPCGSASNRKLTYKEDFDGISAIIPRTVAEKDARIGFGADVHAFGKAQDFVMLCGVKIPCDCGLVAHSDGDAALHAVMDAVLSAAGLKDIGHYFPDSDAAFSGADSGGLLKHVVCTVAEKGFKISGVSVAIQAEKPRIYPHVDSMKKRLAELTGADETAVSITAGTCEGLGFVGEKRGICAYCCASLKPIDG